MRGKEEGRKGGKKKGRKERRKVEKGKRNLKGLRDEVKIGNTHRNMEISM